MTAMLLQNLHTARWEAVCSSARITLGLNTAILLVVVLCLRILPQFR